MRRLLILAALAALAGCAPQQASPPQAAACAPEGWAEAAARGARAIVIDGGGEALSAARALACAASAAGQAVILGAPADLAAALLAGERTLAVPGARLIVFQFDAPAPHAAARHEEERQRLAGEARGDAFARSVATAEAAAPDLMILVVPAPEASSAPVGLSGHQWAPLGARLPAERTLHLRAEASARPGLRVRLQPFEDVPLRGAALKYDGLIEVGPPG